MNPWLTVPLEAYEAHMSMSTVAQAQFLAQLFHRRVMEFSARSVAIVGCAGGNGLDQLPPEQVERVVGIDINPRFIASTRKRYGKRFSRLELICQDIQAIGEDIAPVEFAYAALVFEYTDYVRALRSVARLVAPEGRLSVVLQLPNVSIPAVTPTPYTVLQTLESSFSFVPPVDFTETARVAGFRLRTSERVTLPSDKTFLEFLFLRTNDRAQDK